MVDELEKDATVVTVISQIAPQTPEGGDACLVVISGNDLGKKFTLNKSSTLIGRSPKTDILLDGDSISRNHAMIAKEGGRILARDLGSTNGTYVNDVPVKELELRDGDQIKIGRTIFKFLSGNNVEHAYHEEIYRLTTIDGMTQIYNKRYFLEGLEREMSRSLRYGRNLSLAMLDLDHFKQVNDNYGHLAGDFVLKQVAQHIETLIRRDDSLARYGGEEFSLICPETDKHQAMKLAEKLRRHIERKVFTFDGVSIPVTISCGVADLNEYRTRTQFDPTSGEVRIFDFVKIADDRLYTAKRLGRNVVVAD